MENKPSFRLDIQPWIKVSTVKDFKTIEVSLLDLFKNAKEYKRIEGHPVDVASIYNFILCVAHAAHNLNGMTCWKKLWNDQDKYLDKIVEFIKSHKDYWDLFDDKYPFGQDRDLENPKYNNVEYKTFKSRHLQIWNRQNKSRLFDSHYSVDNHTPLSPAEAARAVLSYPTFQQQVRGRSEGNMCFAFSVIVEGENLAQTLIANMIYLEYENSSTKFEYDYDFRKFGVEPFTMDIIQKSISQSGKKGKSESNNELKKILASIGYKGPNNYTEFFLDFKVKILLNPSYDKNGNLIVEDFKFINIATGTFRNIQNPYTVHIMSEDGYMRYLVNLKKVNWTNIEAIFSKEKNKDKTKFLTSLNIRQFIDLFKKYEDKLSSIEFRSRVCSVVQDEKRKNVSFTFDETYFFDNTSAYKNEMPEKTISMCNDQLKNCSKKIDEFCNVYYKNLLTSNEMKHCQDKLKNEFETSFYNALSTIGRHCASKEFLNKMIQFANQNKINIDQSKQPEEILQKIIQVVSLRTLDEIYERYPYGFDLVCAKQHTRKLEMK